MYILLLCTLQVRTGFINIYLMIILLLFSLMLYDVLLYPWFIIVLGHSNARPIRCVLVYGCRRSQRNAGK